MNLYERIRADIVDGSFQPGDSLVETALATRYGISRTPIREALHRLAHDGLVEKTARGMQVRLSSPEEILDIYEVRITLETAAARAAAARRTDLDVLRLKAAHNAMAGLDSIDNVQMADRNRLFHETVWAASHNSTLVDLLARLYSHLVRYPATTLAYENRWSIVLSEHAELIAAIEARDEATAAALAEQHMAGAREIRLKMYGERP